MKTTKPLVVLLCCTWLVACAAGGGDTHDRHAIRAGQTLDSLYKYYGVPGCDLLRENYPFSEDYLAGYVSEEQASRKKQFAYLWPFSGTFSAVNALYEATGEQCYLRMLEEKVLPGLENYLDISRQPPGYASYINSAPPSDRYYDDNVWLGIDFTDLYLMTGRKEYLAKAVEVWRFVDSGSDELLGGGIYWCEQTRASKNTCSNAPGAVLALKLYRATGDRYYLDKGIRLYDWTMETLRDEADDLYWDNISLSGRVDRTKYSYNSGQMIQAGALLYEIAGEKEYLRQARRTARSSMERFTALYAPEDGSPALLLPENGNNIWFTAVMMRGVCELWRLDGDRDYIDAFSAALDRAWTVARDGQGLFASDWAHGGQAGEKWLLNQAAVVKMMARIGGTHRETTATK